MIHLYIGALSPYLIQSLTCVICGLVFPRDAEGVLPHALRAATRGAAQLDDVIAALERCGWER